MTYMLKSGDEGGVALDHKYVFIVLEFSNQKRAEHVHGVYTTRQIANGKLTKVAQDNPGHGYLAVLKKPIEGPTKRPLFSY